MPRRVPESMLSALPAGYLAAGGGAIFVLAFVMRGMGIAVVLPLMIAASVLWIAMALRVTETDTRVVRRAIFGAFAVRWGLAIVLYCASLYAWPLMRPLQVGNGFWLFCMDALGYHTWAPRIAEALAWGLPLPDPGTTVDYFLVVGAIYEVFGASPLTAIAINILAWTLATVFLLGLFRVLRERPVPAPLVVVLSFWPSGLIWPTQLMKDSLTALFVVLAAVAIVHLIRSRDTRSAATSLVGLALALVPLVRLRIYNGRILFASALVAAVAGIIAARFGTLQPWRTVVLATFAALVISVGVVGIAAPDPFELLAPADPVAAYLRYATALEARGDLAGAYRAREIARELEMQAALQKGNQRFEEPTSSRSLGALLITAVLKIRKIVADSIAALAPDQLGLMRRNYVGTGGNSALSPDDAGLGGWLDAIWLTPGAVIDGLLAPLPWDVFRPRGITGQFRTFATSESVLMMILLPAIGLGLLRLRRTEEFFVAALAAGGILSLGLVITNLGTMFRLRGVFTLILIGFAAYGFDAYERLWQFFRSPR